MTKEKAQNQEAPKQPGKREGETDAAYEQRIRMEAETAGVAPDEYKDKLNQDSGTV